MLSTVYIHTVQQLRYIHNYIYLYNILHNMHIGPYNYIIYICDMVNWWWNMVNCHDLGTHTHTQIHIIIYIFYIYNMSI